MKSIQYAITNKTTTTTKSVRNTWGLALVFFDSKDLNGLKYSEFDGTIHSCIAARFHCIWKYRVRYQYRRSFHRLIQFFQMQCIKVRGSWLIQISHVWSQVMHHETDTWVCWERFSGYGWAFIVDCKMCFDFSSRVSGYFASWTKWIFCCAPSVWCT